MQWRENITFALRLRQDDHDVIIEAFSRVKKSEANMKETYRKILDCNTMHSKSSKVRSMHLQRLVAKYTSSAKSSDGLSPNDMVASEETKELS